MLGLACASCATSTSHLTHLTRIGSGLGAIDVNRRQDGGLMVSSIYMSGPAHPGKGALIRRFNQAARATGCVNGAVPTYKDSIEMSGDRLYMLSTFYKCD
jgi:hypothetical protein